MSEKDGALRKAKAETEKVRKDKNLME